MDKYKKYVPIVIVAVVVLLVGQYILRGIDIRDGYSVALGEYRAKAAYAKILTARVKKENERLAKEMILLDKDLAGMEKDLAGKNATIKKLTAKQGELESDLAAAQTDGEKVVLLTGLVATWTEKYNALYSVSQIKDGEIETWQRKFLNQKAMSDNYKALWEDAEGRVAAIEKVRSKLEGDLRVARVGSRTKTCVTLAAVGVIAYTLVKK